MLAAVSFLLASVLIPRAWLKADQAAVPRSDIFEFISLMTFHDIFGNELIEAIPCPVGIIGAYFGKLCTNPAISPPNFDIGSAAFFVTSLAFSADITANHRTQSATICIAN